MHEPLYLVSFNANHNKLVSVSHFNFIGLLTPLIYTGTYKILLSYCETSLRRSKKLDQLGKTFVALNRSTVIM